MEGIFGVFYSHGECLPLSEDWAAWAKWGRDWPTNQAEAKETAKTKAIATMTAARVAYDEYFVAMTEAATALATMEVDKTGDVASMPLWALRQEWGWAVRKCEMGGRMSQIHYASEERVEKMAQVEYVLAERARAEYFAARRDAYYTRYEIRTSGIGFFAC